MPRRAEIQPRTIEADAVHGSVLVAQLVNRLMLNGKKSIAERTVYDALAVAHVKTGNPKLEVLEQAESWEESAIRQRRWVPFAEAAVLLADHPVAPLLDRAHSVATAVGSP